MAETTEEVKTETRQVYEIGKGFVDKVVEKRDHGVPATTDIQLIKAAADAAAAEQPPVITTEKKPEGAPTEEKKPDSPPAFEPGSYIKERFGSFGLESEKDLEDVLKNTTEVTRQFGELKTKAAEWEKKAGEPKFRTEQEEKIASFLGNYDPSKFGEGLNTVAELMAMDVKTVSDRRAMEEAYIIKKPHLTRDEAKEKFNREFDKRYTVNREDHDTDSAYNDAKREKELDIKDEAAQARETLLKNKELLKAAPPTEKKEDKVAEQKPAEVAPEVLTKQTQEVDKFMNGAEKGKGFDRFNFVSDDGKDTLYSLVLDKAKLDDISGFMKNYYKDPGNYSKDGKTPNFTPSELARTATLLLHGDWFIDQMWKDGVKVAASRLKAEQIASQSPDKKSAGDGDAKLSITDQFVKLAETAVQNRQRR